MAKKRGVKSQAIRELLKENRKMPVSEIVTRLGEKGIKVSRNQVYYIRLKIGAKRRGAVRRKAEQMMGGNGDALTLIRGIKNLAAEAGGLGKLKELVEAMGE